MPTPQISNAYLRGLLHDGTERKTTFRIATKSFVFAKEICKGIHDLGRNAWVYKEGKNRNLWIVEFSKSFLKRTKLISRQNKIDYLRGYFDAEGGIAKNSKVHYYLYYCQKNKTEMEEIKEYLERLGINCGKVHNPSKRIDPNYWRLFIRARSFNDFAKIIGSIHPDKRKYLRMKI